VEEAREGMEPAGDEGPGKPSLFNV